MSESGKVQVEELLRSVTKTMSTEFIKGFCGNTVFGDEIRSVQSCE